MLGRTVPLLPIASDTLQTVGGQPGPFGVTGFVTAVVVACRCHEPAITVVRTRTVVFGGTLLKMMKVADEHRRSIRVKV